MAERWRDRERLGTRRADGSASRMEPRRRRLLAIVIGLTLLGATVAIATMSSAGEGREAGNNSSRCTTAPANPAAGNNAAAPAEGANADAHQHDAAAPDAAAPDAAAPDAAAPDAAAPDAAAPDAAAPDAAAPDAAAPEAAAPDANAQAANAQAASSSRRRGTCTPTSTTTGTNPTTSPTTSAGPVVVQPDSPGNSCDNSNLPVHDGFQNGGRCVATERGEVPAAENAPSLLIVSAPRFVRANQPFEIRISTRNVERDFFLPAATGGYYVTRSFLNEEGIIHGHVHSAIRLLTTTRSAPDPAPVPAFFKATEDGLGGRTADTFVVVVPTGIPTPGLYQIISWVGDASHAVPMAQRANQAPAVDSVRIVVGRAR